MPVINDVVSAVDAIAPFDLAEEYDNVGLLCGQPWRNVDKILVALDLTSDVVAEAVACGAQLIVTHHPTFFHARKNLVETNAEAIAVSDRQSID